MTDENGNRLGESPNAAKQAIMQVVVSRIGMAVPAMGKVDATVTYMFLSPAGRCLSFTNSSLFIIAQ